MPYLILNAVPLKVEFNGRREFAERRRPPVSARRAAMKKKNPFPAIAGKGFPIFRGSCLGDGAVAQDEILCLDRPPSSRMGRADRARKSPAETGPETYGPASCRCRGAGRRGSRRCAEVTAPTPRALMQPPRAPLLETHRRGAVLFRRHRTSLPARGFVRRNPVSCNINGLVLQGF